jgi:hypothetical protein
MTSRTVPLIAAVSFSLLAGCSASIVDAGYDPSPGNGGGTGGAAGGCADGALGTGAFEWGFAYGDSSGEAAEAVAVDSAGNVIVAGVFAGSIDFGCGALQGEDGAGSTNAFVAKLDPNGRCLWSDAFGGRGPAAATGVAVDAMGNVILTGYFGTSINFGRNHLPGAEAQNLFVAKLDPGGAVEWSQSFGGGQSPGGTIAVDPMGNILVLTYFPIDGGTGGIFVAKLDPTGALTWKWTVPNVAAVGLAVDASGNAFLSGFFSGSVALAGCTLTTTVRANGFVAKLEPGGVCMWSQPLGTVGAAAALSAAVDSGGDVIIAGDFSGSLNLGGATFMGEAGELNLFVTKFDPSGAYLWGEGFAGGEAFASRLAVDPSGNVFVTGLLYGSVDFGGAKPLTSAGGAVLLASFDAGGNYRWARSFGGSLDPPSDGAGIALTPSCHVVIAGQFKGTLDFGGTPLASAGGGDAFVAKFSP